MPKRILVNGGSLSVNGQLVAVPNWDSLTAWTHSWDVADSSTYADDGSGWDIDPATRIETILDRGTNNMPVQRDNGAWGNTVGQTAFPGAVYLPGSQRFNGRAAAYHDFLAELDVPEFGGLHDAHSTLSPNLDPEDSSTWFNAPNGYDTPYWCAMLCRLPNGSAQTNGSAWDAHQGYIGTTVSLISNVLGTPRRWGATTGVAPGTAWPATGVFMDDNVTVLIVTRVDGSNSFMEINWRDSNGDLVTDRTDFTLTNYTAKELYFGFPHTTYWTTAGLKLGLPDENDIDRVREWSAQFMPIGGFLAPEG